MALKIARGGWPWILGPVGLGLAAGAAAAAAGACTTSRVLYGLGVVGGLFMVYFFRDPDRTPPEGDGIIVSGADGVVRAVETLPEHRWLKADCVRISVFLSPADVHVNRAPMGGKITGLDYTPGKHLLTIRNAASEHNEHSSIRIEGPATRCLVKQIVGPVVRRVVYWLEEGQQIGLGDRIGMMKFGSRLDMYFPAADVAVQVKRGDRVRAGRTVVATLRMDTTQ